MNNRKHKAYILSVVIIILIAALMTACKTDDITARAENEEKLLKAMTEYPGNGLYDPAENVIGLDAPEPTEEELAESEQKAAEEKEAWQKAVGDCFADGMFDTFYKEWFRTGYLGVAQANGLETVVTSFGIEDDAKQSSDNIEHALITVNATDEDGATKSFDMDWQIIFDKDDTDLIQKVELTDDGGFWEAYTDSVEIEAGLTAVEDETTGTRTIETDHFSLTLSNSDTWGYELDEYGRITIYSNKARDAGFGGRVMSVEVWNDPEKEPYDGAIPYKSIGTIDGKLLIVTYASDVQYDFNDEAAADEYIAIRNETEAIQEGGTSGPLILK
ncbi:MAG: hypothetical protein IJG48_06660 [Mogibacterium sp.]|nr:hypothetical protein [Mogibacterium sp.]